MRAPGLYAVLGGEEIPVLSHSSDHVSFRTPYGSERHEMEELDDLLSVSVFAQWRGGKISVSAVSSDECGFYTNDGALARREGLAGDFYNGWHGAAALSELTDVVTKVTSIHRGRA